MRKTKYLKVPLIYKIQYEDKKDLKEIKERILTEHPKGVWGTAYSLEQMKPGFKVPKK